FFFFSSRRRHTRSDRDWSSDVCSSDLRDWREPERGGFHAIHLGIRNRQFIGTLAVRKARGASFRKRRSDLGGRCFAEDPARAERSEERRVGKECRSRWWPCDQKK